MSTVRKICLVCVLVLFFSLLGIASGLAEVKIFTHIEASGTSFNRGDSFSVYVVPVNSSSSYYTDLKVNLSLPENVVITDTVQPLNPDTLDPFEAKVFEYIVRNTTPEAPLNLPKTGDDGPLVYILMLLGGIALFIICCKRGFKKGTSLFLIVCLCIQFIPSLTKAEENLIIGEEGRLTLEVDGKDMTFISSATAVKGADLSETDADGDGLTALEESLYESDDTKVDTDGDGLTDPQEVSLFLTDPTKVDTDGNGIADGHEDADNDGLDNLDELSRGTDPISDDTDRDGLNDGDEVTRGTDPLKDDTDGDGMMDGFEVAHGFNPLAEDQQVTIETGYGPDEASSSVTARITVRSITGVQAQSLHIYEIPSDDIFLGDHMPGWIGNACEIVMEDSSGGIDATLTMTYDKSLIGSNFEPAIFYFDEENQLLIEEADQTDDRNGSVTAHLTHFSSRVVLNKAERTVATPAPSAPSVPAGPKVVISPPSSETGLILVEDSDLRVSKAVTELISDVWYYIFNISPNGNPIYGGSDNKFTKKITEENYTPYSKNAYSEETPSGTWWTDWYNPAAFLEYLLEWGDYTRKEKNAIYFVTSTVDQLTEAQAEAIAKTAKSKKAEIHIIVVTMDQEYSDATLAGVKKVTSLTGGKYYLVNSLADLYETDGGSEVVDTHPSYDKDSNNDKLSDGDTWDIVNGYVKSDVFGNVFDGYTYEQIQRNRDLDDDGLINGDEIKVVNKKVIVSSLPTLRDSDYDGKDDKSEVNKGYTTFDERLQNYSTYKWEDSGLDNSINVKLHMDYRWFTRNPELYNSKLATTSILMASLSYLDDVDEEKHQYKLDNKEREEVCSKLLGFEDIVASNLSTLKYHNAHATIGHHEFEYAGKRHMVIFVGVTGYIDKGWEWVSNFTVGNPIENDEWYRAGWRDKDNHMGFDIPANKLADRVIMYLTTDKMKELTGKMDEIHIWTVGHSRGAAVSNLFAAKVVDGALKDAIPRGTSCDVSAYDFATPRGTTKSSHSDAKYKCIFNIINNADPVPMLPLSDWRFYQFGQLYRFDLFMKDVRYKSELFEIVKNNYGSITSAEKVLTKMSSNIFHKIHYNGRNISEYYSDKNLMKKFIKEFHSISNNRIGLYTGRVVKDARLRTLTLDELYISHKIRGKIEDFLRNEQNRDPRYTTPDFKPDKAQEYYSVSSDYNVLAICPEFMMVLMGYGAGRAIKLNLGPLKDFYKYSQDLSYANALIGLTDMALGSGLLATHIDPVYYLGSYFCTKSTNYNSFVE